MKIVSVNEDLNIEKRISITPEIAKKYISNGFNVSLPKNYGAHLGFSDKNFTEIGVQVFDDKKIFESANIIVQLGLPSDEILSLIKKIKI